MTRDEKLQVIVRTLRDNEYRLSDGYEGYCLDVETTLLAIADEILRRIEDGRDEPKHSGNG